MKKTKKKFIKSTPLERLEFLRMQMRSVTANHGVPCMCTLCEALQFDSMARMGKINLRTGERK